MRRLARLLAKGDARPAVPRDVQDGLADLRDFCLDPETRTTTPVAGEALAGLHRLYHLGEFDRAGQAHAALRRLRERNWEYSGQDVPPNHVPVYKGFRRVVEGLIHAVERDHAPALEPRSLAR